MNRKLLAVFLIMILVQGACSLGSINPNSVVGSGKVASEIRSVSGFSSVALQGSGNVDVTLGDTESVIIEADDNILPLIETNVLAGQLIISTKGYTTINPITPVRVNVTMKTLKGLTLSGSGNIHVAKMAGDSLMVNLPGSGNITVTGSVTNVDASLSGSGNIYCSGLQAKSATVTLNGSGEVEVFASQSLNAGVLGSGTIRYGGNPSQISKSISGSGSINPLN